MRVFLVSGWATGTLIWEPVARMLSSVSDVQLVSWDAAMDGKLGELILDCRDDCLVGGWSMGGQLAMNEVSMSHGRVRGLFLVSAMMTLVMNENGPGVDPSVPSRIARMLRRDRRKFLRAFFEECLSPSVDENAVTELTGAAGEFSTNRLIQGLDYMRGFPSAPPPGVPLMALHGIMDLVIPWQCSAHITASSPSSTLMTIDEAGHLLPLTHAKEVGGRLIEFCNRCSA